MVNLNMMCELYTSPFYWEERLWEDTYLLVALPYRTQYDILIHDKYVNNFCKEILSLISYYPT